MRRSRPQSMQRLLTLLCLFSFLSQILAFNALGTLSLSLLILRPPTHCLHSPTPANNQNTLCAIGYRLALTPRPIQHRALGRSYQAYSRILVVIHITLYQSCAGLSTWDV